MKKLRQLRPALSCAYRPLTDDIEKQRPGLNAPQAEGASDAIREREIGVAIL
jgi:hypothetical protein